MSLSSKKQLRSFLNAYLEGRKPSVALACALYIVLGLTEGFGLLLILPMLEVLGTSGNSGGSWISGLFDLLGLPRDLRFLLVLFVVLVSFRAILTGLAQIHDNNLQFRFLTQLRNRFFEAITHANWVFFSKKRGSDLIQVLATDLNRVGMGAWYLGRLTGASTMTSIYVLLAFGIAPLVSLGVFLAGGVLVLSLRSRLAAARKAGAGLTHHQNAFFASAGEHLQGMKVVKSFGLEEQHINRFTRTTEDIRSQIMTFIKLQATTRLVFEIGAVVILAVVVYFGSLNAPVHELLVLIILYARIMPRISSMVGDFQQLIHMMPAYTAAMDIRDQCLAAAEAAPDHQLEPLRLAREIRFQEVRFGYQAGNQPALEHVDLSIPARKTTAVVGASGAGKSTLADLLMGLAVPDEGRIEIDDIPLSGERIHAWRHALGYVPQETWLFNDSIRANLNWASPQADEAGIREALEQASALDFVSKLPQGLDTMVGDRGSLLSGGERQRLALARALLRQPELLLLDEATSSLDTDNEDRILKAIDHLHGDMTIIMIAHRLSTVRHADFLIVLEAGRVVEAGERKRLETDPQSRFAAMIRREEKR